uniref:Trace amine-associated receptor 4-like n=1 Tax=Callorhinchus milii TaxID=7868 RepID=A0A4W3I3A7_CALMI
KNLSQEEGDNLQYCFEFNMSCPKSIRSTTTTVTMYIFITISIVITILGNSVVMISILHFKQLQTPTNYLVLSLAFVDFLMGFFVLPFSMVRSVETCWYFGDTFCDIHSTLDVVLTTVSIYNLCFIAIDRYYAVCEPLLYSIKMTLPMTALIITLNWLFAIIYGSCVFLSEFTKKASGHYRTTISCKGSCIEYRFGGHMDALIVLFIPTFIILGIYLKIYFVQRKHARKIGNMPNNINSKEEINVRVLQTKEKTAAKNQGVVMGIFVLSWLPFYLSSIINPYLNFATPPILFEAFTWFGFFNSAFNPVLYAFFYPWFRTALKSILTCQILRPESSIMNLFPE